MLKYTCFLLVLLAVTLPIQAAAADTVHLSADTDKGSYTTAGSVNIKVTVSNPSDTWNVSGVSVVATGQNLTFSYSPTSATINAGREKNFTVTAKGFVWSSTDVEITITGQNTSDYGVIGNSVSVSVSPPSMSIQVIYPQHDMNIPVENVSATLPINFDAIIKNTGDNYLEGVSINVSTDPKKLNCTCSGAKNLDRSKSDTFTVSCSGVNSGEQVLMDIADAHQAVYQSFGVTFNFVKKPGGEKYNISTGGAAREYGNIVEPPSETPMTFWDMFRGDPKRTGVSTGTGDLKKDFQVAWSSLTGPGVFGSPAVADLNGDGKLEIVVPLEKTDGSPQKGLAVFDSKGNLIWDFLSRAAVYSSPAIGDLQGNGKQEIVFGTVGGELYVLDGATGKEIWKLDKHSGFFRSSPLIYDGDGDGNQEIYIGYNQGLYCFDGKSGMEKWNYTADGEISSSPAISNLDSDAGLEVSFGSEHGIFYALNAESGGLAWYLDLGSPIMYSTPAILPDGAVAIGTQDGVMHIIKDGSVAASYATNSSISGSAGIVPRGNKTTYIVFGTAKEADVHGAYQTESSNQIYCIDESGKLIWNASTGGWGVFASPAIADIDNDGNMEVVVGSQQGKLFVLDAETGHIKWSYYDGTGMFASPVLADVDGDDYLEMVLAYRFSNRVKLLDSPSKPDLIIASITFSNEFPDDQVNEGINITVKNIGTMAAGPSTLSVYRRSPILDYLLKNLSVGQLQPGENKTLSFNWTTQFPYPPSKIGIFAVADSANAYNESNELNNGRYKEFGNDLFFVSHDLPNLDGIPGSVSSSASAVVKNVGRLDLAGVKVAIIEGTGKRQKELAEKIVKIDVSKEVAVNFTFTYKPSPLVQRLAIVIDPNDTIQEVFENNNVFETNVTPPVINNGTVNQAGNTNGNGSGGTNLNLLILVLILVVVVVVALKLKSRKRLKKKKGGEERVGKRLGEIKGFLESSDDVSSGPRLSVWRPERRPDSAVPEKKWEVVGTDEGNKPEWVDGATSEVIDKDKEGEKESQDVKAFGEDVAKDTPTNDTPTNNTPTNTAIDSDNEINTQQDAPESSEPADKKDTTDSSSP